MSDLLTVQYIPDPETVPTKVSIVADGLVSLFGDKLVEQVNTGAGHKVVSVCQMLVVDEVRLRVVRGEFQCPVEVQHWDAEGQGHRELISKYGTIPWSGLPDPSLERSEAILTTGIERRRQERTAARIAKEQENGN